MPSSIEHREKAVSNEEFAEFVLSSGDYLDWVVTGIFYSALHYVDGYLATFNIHPRSHSDTSFATGRDTYVNRHLRQIYLSYRDLKQDSIEARYNMQNFTESQIQNVILPIFNNIKNTIAKLIGQNP